MPLHYILLKVKYILLYCRRAQYLSQRRPATGRPPRNLVNDFTTRRARDIIRLPDIPYNDNATQAYIIKRCTAAIFYYIGVSVRWHFSGFAGHPPCLFRPAVLKSFYRKRNNNNIIIMHRRYRRMRLIYLFGPATRINPRSDIVQYHVVYILFAYSNINCFFSTRIHRVYR